jgi:hypothetical protein
VWLIVSIVTFVGFGDQSHRFDSRATWPTKEACEAAIFDDTDELLDELAKTYGIKGQVHVEAHCEQAGEPA